MVKSNYSYIKALVVYIGGYFQRALGIGNFHKINTYMRASLKLLDNTSRDSKVSFGVWFSVIKYKFIVINLL